MKELPKAFEPGAIEEKWYAFWEENSFFKADVHSKKKPYCICMPPPNVTGILHMGHALVETLQDVLTRWRRMCGDETLWIPGTDHAGIATQTVVERHLLQTTGKRRVDFSREEFLSHILAWTDKSQMRIVNQLKRLGCSCDWSRMAYTLDETRNRAVRTLFKKMFDAQLIYRGDYLVNWDPVTQTALADDEVEYEERDSFLWYFRYPLEKSSDYITIATTRPETMLADTAIAVSPTDKRYHDLIGQRALLPLMNRPLPILADRLVDPSFGTGAVKITPAHDPNDYEMALRHNLPLINILTPDGKINENAGPFNGLTIQQARQKVLEEMQALGLVAKIEPYRLRVGVSYRSKAVIEPYLSKQWFVKMQGFKQTLRTVVQDKKVQLIPENWENTYFHWIDNLRDWCISRQLWWGHRIPIWYRKEDPTQMICYDGSGDPPEVRAEPDQWTQDEDVLDTWFSSSLWPLSVLGWPDTTEDLKKFYPTSVLVTGHDILFFWVARMIVMGEFLLKTPPFSKVFLHGLIYGKSYWRFNKEGAIAYLSSEERLPYELGQAVPNDIHSKWEKMSKSKGNIIDPMEMIHMYGTDALRMGLCSCATQAREIDLDRRRFEEFKNFSNKIWNGARFVFQNIEDLSTEEFATGLHPDNLALEDRWILSLLNRTVLQVNQHLTQFAFDKAALVSYDFFWKEFCAYYVELSKPIFFGKTGTADSRVTKQKIVTIVLTTLVCLLHPMAPFITEELFWRLKCQFPQVPSASPKDPYTKATLLALSAKACIIAPYPQVICPEDINPQIEEMFAFLERILHAIRTIRADMQLPPSIATDVIVQAHAQDDERRLLEQHQGIIQALVRTNTFTFTDTEQTIPLSASTRIGNLKIIIPLPEALKEKEKVRLIKEKEKWIQQQNQLRIQLSNPAFLEKAPTALVEKLKTTLVQAENSLSDIMHKLDLL